MNRMICFVMIAVVSIAAGCAAADRPLDQGRIISVRPAIPDGAKAFVAQQSKPPKPPQKPLFEGWFKKKPQQPRASKPTNGKSFWDIFNPAKWGNKTAPQNATAPQQQIPRNQLTPGQPVWQQQGDITPGPQPASESAYGQMPPPNIVASTSRPG